VLVENFFCYVSWHWRVKEEAVEKNNPSASFEASSAFSRGLEERKLNQLDEFAFLFLPACPSGFCGLNIVAY
jgi:hypothetical protein